MIYHTRLIESNEYECTYDTYCSCYGYNVINMGTQMTKCGYDLHRTIPRRLQIKTLQKSVVNLQAKFGIFWSYEPGGTKNSTKGDSFCHIVSSDQGQLWHFSFFFLSWSEHFSLTMFLFLSWSEHFSFFMFLLCFKNHFWLIFLSPDLERNTPINTNFSILLSFFIPWSECCFFFVASVLFSDL